MAPLLSALDHPRESYDLETDYAAIPRRDLPFGVPDPIGDDAWVRATNGHGSVTRPDPFTISWVIPKPTP